MILEAIKNLKFITGMAGSEDIALKLTKTWFNSAIEDPDHLRSSCRSFDEVRHSI